MDIKQVVQTSDPNGRPELIQLFVRTGAINLRDHAGDLISLDSVDSTFVVEIDVAKLLTAIGRKAAASKGRYAKSGERRHRGNGYLWRPGYRVMTTYLLLALTDDGRVTVQDQCGECRDGKYPHESDCAHGEIVLPVRTGTDRNAYSTYEVAGYSIDVVKLPEGSR